VTAETCIYMQLSREEQRLSSQRVSSSGIQLKFILQNIKKETSKNMFDFMCSIIRKIRSNPCVINFSMKTCQKTIFSIFQQPATFTSNDVFGRKCIILSPRYSQFVLITLPSQRVPPLYLRPHLHQVLSHLRPNLRPNLHQV